MLWLKNQFKLQQKPINVVAFWVILLLIICSPVLGHFKLIVKGERTKGVVRLVFENKLFVNPDKSLFYNVGGVLYEIPLGRLDEIKQGRTYTVLYDKLDPNKAVVFSIWGFFSGVDGLIALLLFLFWLVFYFSLKDFSKKEKQTKKLFPKIPWKLK